MNRCTLYHKSCLPVIEAILDAGERKIAHFFPAVKVREVTPVELEDIDSQGRSFRNINTPRSILPCAKKSGETPPV